MPPFSLPTASMVCWSTPSSLSCTATVPVRLDSRYEPGSLAFATTGLLGQPQPVGDSRSARPIRSRSFPRLRFRLGVLALSSIAHGRVADLQSFRPDGHRSKLQHIIRGGKGLSSPLTEDLVFVLLQCLDPRTDVRGMMRWIAEGTPTSAAMKTLASSARSSSTFA